MKEFKAVTHEAERLEELRCFSLVLEAWRMVRTRKSHDCILKYINETEENE
jgi:hypothetical protein